MRFFNLSIAALVILDFLAFFLSLRIAYLIFPLEIIAPLYWMPVLGCTGFLLKKSYVKHLAFLQESVEIVETNSFLLLAGVFILFFHHQFSIGILRLLLFAWVNSLYLVPLARYTGRSILVKYRLWERTYLILGAGKTGQFIADLVVNEAISGNKILGFLTEGKFSLSEPIRLSSGKEIQILGVLESAEDILKNKPATDVILVVPDLHGVDLANLVRRLQRSTKNVWIIPDLFDVPVDREIRFIFKTQGLLLQYQNKLSYRKNIFLKRSVDLTIGSIALLLSLPLFLLISIALKFESQGPVIFVQTRIGKNGKPFKCLKFRTMYPDAEKILPELLAENPSLYAEWQKNFKLKSDPRVTKVGKFLRKTSWDELPQIINVLKGEMSLVGPRPALPRELDIFGQYLDSYLQVRPGITGLWQVSGRSDTTFMDRVNLDNWYICNWSIWLDIIILLRTIVVVLNRRGAY